MGFWVDQAAKRPECTANWRLIWLLVTMATDLQGPVQTICSDGQAGSKQRVAELLTCKAESAMSVLQPVRGACLCCIGWCHIWPDECEASRHCVQQFERSEMSWSSDPAHQHGKHSQVGDPFFPTQASRTAATINQAEGIQSCDHSQFQMIMSHLAAALMFIYLTLHTPRHLTHAHCRL